MIRAGKKTEISSAEDWLILDIGFANKATSCGLIINEEAPVALQFNDAKERMCRFISSNNAPVNLIIESPLSVAFDIKGNPKGRSIEKRGQKTRYWYAGLGCTVMVAALYLIKAISETPKNIEVILFEGFVSFKDTAEKSDHLSDVSLLREVVKNPKQFYDKIYEAEALKIDSSDILKSAFHVAGIDAGIPPVIVRNGTTTTAMEG